MWYNVRTMRADRLISLLMLLQTRGRMTAQDLSTELEVSERTIYRDIAALGASGIPVHCESGPGGGCMLLDSYRTTLTGLTADEVRALFALSMPAPLARLGMSQTLKGALLKLSAALPAAQRNAAGAQQRIHLDSSPWFDADEPVPALQALHAAVWQDHRLRLTRRVHFASFLDTQIEYVVEPLGLVAKASTWYLVCQSEGQRQVFRVSEITAVEVLAETFARPAGFDLAEFWRRWCAGVERSRPHYPVLVRVAPGFLPNLPFYMNGHAPIAPPGPPDAAGWITVTLAFETLEDARAHILAQGGALEVLEPQALRLSVIDSAHQTLAACARPGATLTSA
jgi:predicted DNA-binding transcriptional regulator YafY